MLFFFLLASNVSHPISSSLRKHAYSNIYWEFYHQKNVNFQMKNSDIFLISAQNIDCVLIRTASMRRF